MKLDITAFDRSQVSAAFAALKPIIGPFDGREHLLRIEAEALMSLMIVGYDSGRVPEDAVRVVLGIFNQKINEIHALLEEGV